jgi:hypothetical protein
MPWWRKSTAAAPLPKLQDKKARSVAMLAPILIDYVFVFLFVCLSIIYLFIYG